MDLSKYKVPDLKKELKLRGLSTGGNKTELMERLHSALTMKTEDTASAESVDDLDEDLLNDDDLDHEQLDASESVLKELDEHLDVSPTIKTPKRKFEPSKSTDTDQKSKKLVLNRTPSTASESSKDNQNGVGVNASTVISSSAEDKTDKKVVKLSELNLKERLEMRAKKFGAPQSDEARKLARAQRFSLENTSSTAGSSPVTENTNMELLKKRAERFGGSVSKVMSGLEQQQRLEMRKARFDVGTTANGMSLQSEKAKQRLERFKTPVQ